MPCTCAHTHTFTHAQTAIENFNRKKQHNTTFILMCCFPDGRFAFLPIIEHSRPTNKFYLAYKIVVIWCMCSCLYLFSLCIHFHFVKHELQNRIRHELTAYRFQVSKVNFISNFMGLKP